MSTTSMKSSETNGGNSRRSEPNAKSSTSDGSEVSTTSTARNPSNGSNKSNGRSAGSPTPVSSTATAPQLSTAQRKPLSVLEMQTLDRPDLMPTITVPTLTFYDTLEEDMASPRKPGQWLPEPAKFFQELIKRLPGLIRAQEQFLAACTWADSPTTYNTRGEPMCCYNCSNNGFGYPIQNHHTRNCFVPDDMKLQFMFLNTAAVCPQCLSKASLHWRDTCDRLGTCVMACGNNCSKHNKFCQFCKRSHRRHDTLCQLGVDDDELEARINNIRWNHYWRLDTLAHQGLLLFPLPNDRPPRFPGEDVLMRTTGYKPTYFKRNGSKYPILKYAQLPYPGLMDVADPRRRTRRNIMNLVLPATLQSRYESSNPMPKSATVQSSSSSHTLADADNHQLHQPPQQSTSLTSEGTLAELNIKPLCQPPRITNWSQHMEDEGLISEDKDTQPIVMQLNVFEREKLITEKQHRWTGVTNAEHDCASRIALNASWTTKNWIHPADMMKIVPGNYCDDMDPIVAAREARRIQQLLTGSEDNTAEPMAGTTDYLKFVRQLTEKFSLFDQLKSIPLSLSKEPANLSCHAISEHATINPVKLPNINEFLVNEKMHPGVYTEWIQAVCNLLENEMNE